MFLLNEHCMTPSTSLQAISSRVPYKHKSFSTLSKDLLKAKHAPNPDPLRFLALRLEERALSSVSFLGFPHQRTPRVFLIIPVYLYVTWQMLSFPLSQISPVPPPRLENLADVLTQHTNRNAEEHPGSQQAAGIQARVPGFWGSWPHRRARHGSSGIMEKSHCPATLYSLWH